MCQNRELGEKTNDDEIRAMINEFDRDGDGESNRNVFLNRVFNFCFIIEIVYFFLFFFKSTLKNFYPLCKMIERKEERSLH